MNKKHTPEQEFGSLGDAFFSDTLKIIDDIQMLRDRIVSVQGARTVENTVRLMAEIDILLDAGLNYAELMQSVHPNEGMRKAAEVGHQKLAKVASNLELDRELYDAFDALEKTLDEPDAILRRYLTHTLRDFRRAGVDRDEATRDRIRHINERLVLLAQEFNRNIRNDTRFVTTRSVDDLQGLPEDYIAAHSANENGEIKITTDYPDFVPVMSYARSSELRRSLFYEYTNRAYPANEKVLKKILTARHELAGLVGHDSFASFAADNKMIGSAEAIADFIERIAAIAEPRSKRDYGTLLDRKRRDYPDAEGVEDFEKSYYSELVRSENLHFDSQEMRPYLDYQRVKEGVLAVTSGLFDLEFRRVAETAWHESVEIYDVFAEDCCMGRFYLDMHPRESKYKHAAMFPIVSGVSGVQLPKAALVCNLPEPVNGAPALLEHGDVVTLFHELGHLLHHILGGRQPFVRFSGVATEWDFVEVPSQLLEEWAYSYDTLKQFAVHFETGEVIPEEMVARMNRARRFGRGSRVSQQMFYAALSYRFHIRDPDGLNLTEVLRELQERYSPYSHMEGTHLHASFGHLEGYSALYYTYMWSLVIARDLFEPFAEADMFDTALAVKYRNTVLEPGGSEDAAVLIRNFVDRDYDFAAFEKWVNE